MKDKRSILIGSFDGLHIGHQYLIREFKRYSKELKLNPSILSYNIHPLKILRPSIENYYLDNDKERTERLIGLGSTILCDFNEFKCMTAKEFFKELLLRYSDVSHIFMGHDSSFGKDQVSSLTELQSYDSNLKFIQLPKFSKFNVSSTLIRSSINRGEIENFKKFTNRDFVICSTVIPGKQLGRTIGFPTANLYVDTERVRLPNGVFFGKVKIKENNYLFVANIGLRPTIDNDEAISIEAHILDFDQDIYGQEVSLVICGKVRDIIKFNSKEELMNQINQDVDFVRSFYA